MSKKFLLLSCFVSGMLIASENKLCEIPGKHEVKILNEHPQYDARVAGPIFAPLRSKEFYVLVINFRERNKFKSSSQFSVPVHSVGWGNVQGSDVLYVDFCDGTHSMLEVKIK